MKYSTIAIVLITIIGMVVVSVALSLPNFQDATITSTAKTITTTITSSTTSTITTTGGAWVKTADYPSFTGDLSCVTSGEYLYCVGGYNDTAPSGQGYLNRTYFSHISSTGLLSPWVRTTDYPISAEDQRCVTSSGYIYCVGGIIGSTKDDPYGRIANVYYAQFSPKGIGKWAETAPFPHIILSARCFSYSRYIYCDGGHFNKTLNGWGAGVADIYSAPLSANGVGKWTRVAGLPTPTAAFSVSNGYAYAYGGGQCGHLVADCTSPSYYAPLSSNGGIVGEFRRTTDMPTAGWALYLTANSNAYYFTSPIYVAHLSSNGIGPWINTTNVSLPPSSPTSCVASGATTIYCIGGYNFTTRKSTNSTYFTHIEP